MEKCHYHYGFGAGGGDDRAGVRLEVSAVNYIMDYFMQVAESVISSSLRVARDGNQPASLAKKQLEQKIWSFVLDLDLPRSF